MVDVVAILSPVTRETVRAKIPAGKPLRDTLKIPEGVYVSINGRPDRGNPLSEGDLVNLIVVPQGGDTGKDMARMGIQLAAITAATALAGPLGLTTAAGSLTIGGKLFVGAVAIGSTIGAHALIPPTTHSLQADRESFTRLGALTGSRNQILPYGVVPRVYGHRRIYPPMSARPYTEIAGDNQYMRLLFNLGPGPLELSNPRIGDTLIGSFDSDNKFTSNGAFEGIEIEVGESPSLYASRVNQTDPGVTLEEDGQSAIRTTADGVEEISMDITFPSGLFGVDDKGKTIENWVRFKVEFSPTGENNWQVVTDGYTGRRQGLNPRSSKRETLRENMSWRVPKGQYDVRLTREQTKSWGEDDTHFDAAVWTALRGITYEAPTKLPGTVQLAMRIQASDQLSGVLDSFSVEAKSRLAYYDGSQWQVPTFDPSTGGGTGGIVTSNPAWIVADILCGTANSRAIGRARLDEEAFKDWADNCDAEGRSCNIVIDSPRTVLQTASLVSATGRGSLSMRDNGIYSIIQDTEQTIPVQHFTPRNSWGFSSTRTFPDVPHAIRVNFVNPDRDWQTDEAIVYDDGYDEHTATKFEKLELEGVTNWDQAWKEGRYRLAEMRLRPEVYTLFADVEHIACTRGDPVLVSHDVTMWGLAAGRIKSISGNVLTLDETVTMEAGSTYNIRVRNSAGESHVKEVVTSAGEKNQVTVNNVTGIAVGDLFMFGETGTETQALKVLSVEPQGDLSARLTLVDAAPEIYDADTGPIPPFDSNITIPIDYTRPIPPKPIITGIRTDDSAMYPDADGSPHLRVLVDYTLSDGLPTGIVEGRFRRADDTGGWASFGSVEASIGSIALKDIEAEGEYLVQIRSRNEGRVSEWVTSDPFVVEGKIFPPSQVQGLTAEIDKTLVRLSWDENPETDIRGYEVRKGASFDSGTLVGFTRATGITDKIDSTGTVTYTVKAVDTSGNLSLSAASVLVNLDEAPPEVQEKSSQQLNAINYVFGEHNVKESNSIPVLHANSPALLEFTVSNNTDVQCDILLTLYGGDGSNPNLSIQALANTVETYSILTNAGGGSSWWVRAIFNMDANDSISGVTIGGITLKQYNAKVIINDEGIFARVAPDRVIPLTGSGRITSGGSVGPGAWDDLANKPFSTIGTGLTVTGPDLGLDTGFTDGRYFQSANNLSEGNPFQMRANLGLHDGSADLDLRSLEVGSRFSVDESGDVVGRDAEFRFGVFTQTGLLANTVYYPTYDLGDTGGGPTGGEAPDGGVYILLSSATTDDAPTYGVITSRRSGNSHSENTQIHVSTFNDIGGNPSGGNFEFYGTYDSSVTPQKKVVEYNGHLYYALYIPRKSNDRFPSHWSFSGYHRKIQNSLTAVRADNPDLTDIQDFESHRDYSFYVSRHLDVADGIRMSGTPTIDSNRDIFARDIEGRDADLTGDLDVAGSGFFGGRVTVSSAGGFNHFRAIRGNIVADITPVPVFGGGISVTLQNSASGYGSNTQLFWGLSESSSPFLGTQNVSGQADLGLPNRRWRDLHLGRDALIGRNLFVTGESFFSDDINLDRGQWLDDENSFIRTDTYIGGFAGSGFQLEQEDGRWNMTTDNIFVRFRLQAYEFLLNQLRAGNGNEIFRSGMESGAVETLPAYRNLEDIDTPLEDCDFPVGVSHKVYGLEDLFVPFTEGELIRNQVFTGRGIKGAEATVLDVENGSSTVTDNSTPRYMLISLDYGDDPEEGDKWVALGHETDRDRQGIVGIFGEEEGAPFIRIMDGVDRHRKFGSFDTLVGQLGRVDNITDPLFPELDGSQKNMYALWTNNVFLRENVYIAFDGGVGKLGKDAGGPGNHGMQLNPDNYIYTNNLFQLGGPQGIRRGPDGKIRFGSDVVVDVQFSISWDEVEDKPTYLGSDRIFSPLIEGGTISGGTITGGTISGSTITGGVIEGSSFEVNNGDFWDDTGHFRFGGAQGIRYAGNDVLIGSGVSIDGDVDLVGRIRIGSVEGVSIGLDSSGLSLGYDGEVTFGLASAGTFSGLRWHSPEFGDSYDGFDIFAGSDIRLRPFGDVIIGSASTGFVHINRLGTVHGAFTDPIPMSSSGGLYLTPSNRLIVQINPSGSYDITHIHYPDGVSAGRVLILVNVSSSHTLTCTQSTLTNGFARNLTIRPEEMVWVVRMGSQWVGNST